MLRDAVERRFGGTKFADVPAPGLYVVRGENLAVLGEVVRNAASSAPRATSTTASLRLRVQDEALEEAHPGLTRADIEEVRARSPQPQPQPQQQRW